MTTPQYMAMVDELMDFSRVLSRRFGEDAVSDAIVDMLKRGSLCGNMFHGLHNWKGWFSLLARRHHRRAARRKRLEQPLVEEPGVQILAGPESSEEMAAIQAAVHLLSPVLRPVFIFCVIEGHSYMEAAKQFGLPGGTVRGRIVTAYARLRDDLRSAGHDIPPPRKKNLKNERAQAAA